MKYYKGEDLPYLLPKREFLTKDQEFIYAKNVREGNSEERAEALDKLVNTNLRYVISVAKKYFGRGLSNNDVISLGVDGLLTAAKRFDERRDFRFCSYAVWWIKEGIRRGLVNYSRSLRMPINRVEQLSEVNVVRQKLSQKNFSEPSNYQIAEEMGIKETTVDKLLGFSSTVSIDSKPPGLELPYSDILPDISLLADEEQIELQRDSLLSSSLECLSPRERLIVTSYYGVGVEQQSLDEIGKGISLSRERVRQIRNKALIKMRESTPELEELL